MLDYQRLQSRYCNCAPLRKGKLYGMNGKTDVLTKEIETVKKEMEILKLKIH